MRRKLLPQAETIGQEGNAHEYSPMLESPRRGARNVVLLLHRKRSRR
jgi:hypothetical protein